jgi:ribosomal protein S18 acetylase RimI-like enzyme
LVVLAGAEARRLGGRPYAFSTKLVDWQGDGDTEDRWRNRLTGVPFNVVAELDSRPAGMASSTMPDSAEAVDLLSMWVAPFARGKGVGDALVGAVVGLAESHRVRRIVLRVIVGNQAAIALYRRHAFHATSQVDRNPDGYREAVMLRELAAPPLG